ncbi:MAG: hypothetical protein LAO08_00725 [Acidobacteriia bacterium]|nr:hypothetical protein [Terriglobia bacterium]
MKKSFKRTLITRRVFPALVFLFLLSLARVCAAGDVVYLQTDKDASAGQQHWDIAAQFYGVKLNSVLVKTAGDSAAALKAIESTETLGVVATPAALQSVSMQQLLSAARRNGAKSIPIMIFGITPATDFRQLAVSSAQQLSGCSALPPTVSNASYVVGPKTEITRQLSGVALPAVAQAACGFATANAGGAQAVLSADLDGKSMPVFVRLPLESGDFFFLAAMNPAGALAQLPRRHLPDIFSEVAPEMMFVRYAAGDKGWHNPGHYANLTLDDSFLTEPYGHINYHALLGEMEKHNFHTTIAFIPLNYNRNKPDIIAMFREHPDRYSISVHGNNHDHREFDAYTIAPLANQVANLQQGIARMEQFTNLTGIPYDRVMVFPHAIAPNETFAAMKKYNYLATANSEDVPLGSSAPDDDFLFYLRPVTLRYSNFPTLLRYSAEIPLPKAILAIQLFLDNPALVYGHETLFDEGIATFDPIADEVNAMQPDIHWCGMKCVVEHLYVERRRDDGGVDVRAFAGDLTLENPSPRETTFWVSKQENFQPEIASLTVDGKPQAFDRKQDELAFQVTVSAMSSRHMFIEYKNDLNLASIDVSKTSLYVLMVRRMAEFRDTTLSTWSFGRKLTKYYYKHDLDVYELYLEKIIPFLLLAAVAAGIAKFIKKKSRSKHGQTPEKVRPITTL